MLFFANKLMLTMCLMIELTMAINEFVATALHSTQPASESEYPHVSSSNSLSESGSW